MFTPWMGIFNDKLQLIVHSHYCRETRKGPRERVEAFMAQCESQPATPASWKRPDDMATSQTRTLQSEEKASGAEHGSGGNREIISSLFLLCLSDESRDLAKVCSFLLVVHPVPTSR